MMSMNFHAGCAGENPDGGNGGAVSELRIALKLPGISSGFGGVQRGMSVLKWQAGRFAGDGLSIASMRKRYP
jgi:hypothetical protein